MSQPRRQLTHKAEAVSQPRRQWKHTRQRRCLTLSSALGGLHKPVAVRVWLVMQRLSKHSGLSGAT